MTTGTVGNCAITKDYNQGLSFCVVRGMEKGTGNGTGNGNGNGSHTQSVWAESGTEIK